MQPLWHWQKKYGPGLLFVFVIAAISSWLGYVFPIIGGAVFGILFGIIINNIWGKPKVTVNGVLFSAKKVLQWAIIALGSGLSLSVVWKTGVESAGLMIVSLLLTLSAAYVVGKLLKIPEKLTALIGVGTSICGGSAIAAISPIVEADEADIAYSISTIFLFNLIAVLVFPFLGSWLQMSNEAFGLWAGTAINDTSSVVAAGYTYSTAAGDYATIVKLTRTTMIIPIAIIATILIGIQKKKQAELEGTENSSKSFRISRIFPWFILWFLVASLFNTLGLIEEQLLHYLQLAAKFMIIMALTGIGLSADFRKMMKTGFRPILLGLILWITIAVVSLVLLWLTYGIN